MAVEATILQGFHDVNESLQAFRGEITKLRREYRSQRSTGHQVEHAAKPISTGTVDSGPAKVMVQATVRRIFNVDTVVQTFGCQLVIRMMWRLPATETVPDEIDTDWKPNWIPKYRFRRLMASTGYTSHFDLKEINGVFYVQAEFDHIVEIYEQFELDSFPVDVQDLGIEIVSVQHTDTLKWLPWPNDAQPVVILVESMVALKDFVLVDKIPIVHQLTTIHLEHDACALISQVKVRRKAQHYVLNVAVVMCAITGFTLCAWGVHPADVPSRLVVDLIMLLTAISFKLVLAPLLPKVSYMTLMNAYVLSCFLFLTAVTLCHTLLPFRWTKLKDNSVLTHYPDANVFEGILLDADKIALYVYSGVWSGFNLIYLSYVVIHGKLSYDRYKRAALEQQAKNDAEIKQLRSGLPPRLGNI